MDKVIHITSKLSNREKVSRAVRLYEKKKEKLNAHIEEVRAKKSPEFSTGNEEHDFS